jgi:hypothetical protein
MGIRKTVSLKKLDEIETHCNDVSLYHFGARSLFNELIAEIRHLRKFILKRQKENRKLYRERRKLLKLYPEVWRVFKSWDEMEE